MRYLGIDFGGKRVGVAVSDESQSFAFPLVVLQNTPTLVDEIKKICADQKVGEIVVGESQNFEFEDNKLMEEVRPFVKMLEDTVHLPVHLHPEFLTSAEARQIQGENDMHDASAAALILKSYLDLHIKKEHDNN